FPVYDKPMIYYPLTTLMLGGVRDFVVISSPDALRQLENCLGDGRRWGISFEYVAQPSPGGIADAFLVAERQLSGCAVALALGDNIFYGTGLPQQIRQAMAGNAGATIFAYEVLDPSSFGVVTLDSAGRPTGLEEKPKNSASNFAVPGLYFYDQRAVEFAKRIPRSARGELEITDINRAY